MPDELRDIRREARELLRTASVSPLRFTLFFLAVSAALDLVATGVGSYVPDPAASLPFSFVRILTALLGTVFSAGYVCYCLGVACRGESMPYRALFDALPFAGKVVLLNLLRGALIGLGLSVLVVPGVVLGFCYLFAQFFLCENPELGVAEAMRRSRREMRGRKWSAFLLLSSFWPLAMALAGILLLCESVLTQLLPNTLAGNLLFTLISDAAIAVPMVYLLPWLELSLTIFFRRARESAREEETWGPEV